MAYVEGNPRTKKAVKDMIATGKPVYVFQPGLGTIPQNGTVAIEGPHYPKPHSWYGIATLKNGVVVSVK